MLSEASPSKPEPVFTESSVPLPDNLVHVPILQQRQPYSCGAAATLLVLRYWCVESFLRTEEGELYGPLETTPARGTEPEPMEALLRKSGLEASYRSGNVSADELLRAVDAAEPPIVDLQAWSDHDAPWRETWDAGHYVVLVGYDSTALFFADPSRAATTGYSFMPRRELEERWHDLAGPADARLEHMAIFVRGQKRWRGTSAAGARATRLR